MTSAGAVTTSKPASAQTAISLTVSPLVDDIRKRGPSGTAGVNRQDCLDDLTLGFNLALTGTTATYDLQVWAGEGDCSVNENRLGTTAICKPVSPTTRTTTQSVKARVRVRDLVADLDTRPKPVTYEPADATACDAQSSPSGRTLAVYFLLLTGATVVQSASYKTTGTTPTTTGGAAPASTTQDGIVVDMKGPPAVTNVHASAGDRRLRLEWTPTGDQDARGYVFYCQPSAQAPVDASAPEPVVCEDAATSAAGDASNVTPDAGPDLDAAADLDGDLDGGAEAEATPIVTPPAPAAEAECTPTAQSCPAPTISSATECGRILQKTNAGFTDRTLTNLTDYAIAVAALDAFDNVGDPASINECIAPEAVNDFWKLYNDDGGRAEGFCALEAVGLPAGSNAGLIGLAIASFAIARRKVRRKGRTS
jgi:hypothetical protein